MLSLPTDIYVATEPIDLRLSFAVVFIFAFAIIGAIAISIICIGGYRFLVVANSGLLIFGVGIAHCRRISATNQML